MNNENDWWVQNAFCTLYSGDNRIKVLDGANVRVISTMMASRDDFSSLQSITGMTAGELTHYETFWLADYVESSDCHYHVHYNGDVIFEGWPDGSHFGARPVITLIKW